MRRLAIASVTVLVASPALAQVLVYDASPRIIHVQPQAQAHRAAAPPAPAIEDDDEIIERIERRKQQARRPFWKQAPEPTPRPRAELPPPTNEPRRAVLSAPTPSSGPGSLTPIYPTPRWRNADPPPPVAVDNNE